jgi:CBS domain-containing protein
MCALFHGRSLGELPVGAAIHQQQLQSCEADDFVADVEAVMRQAQVRRLPVTDAQGVLVGMVSLADLSREAARQQPLSDPEVTEVEVNQTLAAICAIRL